MYLRQQMFDIINVFDKIWYCQLRLQEQEKNQKVKETHD